MESGGHTIVLAIDTATLTASVAVARGDAHDCEILASGQSGVNTHSQHLLGLIDQALSESGVTLQDLDGVAVGAGPGSFTGLRIGMATAKGLAFALETPLWAVSSLAAMAMHVHDQDLHPIDDETLVVPILDARRGEIFAGFYGVHRNSAHLVADELVLAPEFLGARLDEVLAHHPFQRVVALGDGLSAFSERIARALQGRARMLTHVASTPSAAGVARLTLGREQRDILVSGAPSYVRLSEAEIKYPDGNPGGAFKVHRRI